MARGLAPLQVVLCTRGGLAGAAVLDRLLASPELRVTGIVLSTRTHGPRRGLVAGTLRHLSRSGLAYSAYLWACTTGGDLAASASSRGSVRSRARREAIALLATRRVNDPDSHAFIAGCAPSLLVTAFFDQRVDAATRALAPLGGMNIHPSALPDLRGVDPVFQAMLRGRPLGVTVHRLV
ncbi:MAG TPA: formyltransferase family protein, partial [Usitatibacter sp.]|nr:formyltransferase family protein [Usitatibacter sp.]